MRNGMFFDLTWETFRQRHQTRWRTLKESYGLVPYDYSVVPTLDQIALDCIVSCAPLLFKPIDLRYASPFWQSISPDLLKASLTQALVEHLIVTFAYRFYCENLQSKYLNEYLDIIFSCTDEASSNMGNNGQSISERKQAFRKNTKGTYKTWSENIGVAFDRYFKESPLKAPRPIISPQSEALLPPNWLFSLTFSCNWSKKSPFALSKVKGQTSIQDFSFIKSYQNHPENSLIDKLTDFLTNSKFIPLLVRTETNDTYPLPLAFSPVNPESSPPPIIELRQVVSHAQLPSTHATVTASGENSLYTIHHYRTEVQSHAFTALPWMSQSYIVETVPPQTYRVVNSDSTVTIAPEIQQIFNNYLIERNFHGHSLATILHCLFRHTPEEVLPRDIETHLQLLTESLRLHAPLVHPQFIRLVDSINPASSALLEDLGWINTALSWINKFIDHLNTTALPVLEELFLWNISDNYSIDEIFSAIQRSFLSPEYASRCDFLNFYRLIPQKSNHRTLSEIYTEQKTNKQDSENIKRIIQVHNLALSNSYLAAMDRYRPKAVRGLGQFKFDIAPANVNTLFD